MVKKLGCIYQFSNLYEIVDRRFKPHCHYCAKKKKKSIANSTDTSVGGNWKIKTKTGSLRAHLV